MSILSQHNIELIEKVFFMGMMDGYVNESPRKSKLVELPGSRLITFEYTEKNEHFVFNDLCFVTKLSDYSSGITTISCDGEPVWIMNYGGRYPKHYIPFLKASLKVTYSQKEFIGGRGPTVKINEEDPRIIYRNDVQCGHFESFKGRESIFSSVTGNEIGWHRYFGNLMV